MPISILSSPSNELLGNLYLQYSFNSSTHIPSQLDTTAVKLNSSINVIEWKRLILNRSLDINLVSNINGNQKLKMDISSNVEINFTSAFLSAAAIISNVYINTSANLNLLTGKVSSINSIIPTLIFNAISDYTTINTINSNFNLNSNINLLNGNILNFEKSLDNLLNSNINLSSENVTELNSYIDTIKSLFNLNTGNVIILESTIPKLFANLISNKVKTFNKIININSFNLANSEYDFGEIIDISIIDNEIYVLTNNGIYKLMTDKGSYEVEFKHLDLHNSVMAIPLESFIYGNFSDLDVYYGNVNLTANKFENLEESRVKLPKGIKNKYIGFKIKSSNPFNISKVNFIGYTINRRRR